MKKIFELKIKPHHLIFIFITIEIIIQILESIFISKNFNLFFLKSILPYSTMVIGAGFLIKYNFKIASIVFIIPIIIQSIIYYKFWINPSTINITFEKIIELFIYFFNIIIVYNIFKTQKYRIN